MILAEPVQITCRIAKELERLGIRYLVGGSLASSLHGIPRTTNDGDIVADIAEAHIPLLVKAFEAECYIDAEMIRDAVRRQGFFNVIHLETMFKVDIFILKSDPASQEEMDRREPYRISDTSDESLFLATAEDVILHKLHWYRLGGSVSDRQWMDVLGVLQVQGDRLDHEYLERMARQRGVQDLLAEAMKEVSTDSSPM